MIDSIGKVSLSSVNSLSDCYNQRNKNQNYNINKYKQTPNDKISNNIQKTGKVEYKHDNKNNNNINKKFKINFNNFSINHKINRIIKNEPDNLNQRKDREKELDHNLNFIKKNNNGFNSSYSELAKILNGNSNTKNIIKEKIRNGRDLGNTSSANKQKNVLNSSYKLLSTRSKIGFSGEHKDRERENIFMSQHKLMNNQKTSKIFKKNLILNSQEYKDRDLRLYKNYKNTENYKNFAMRITTRKINKYSSGDLMTNSFNGKKSNNNIYPSFSFANSKKTSNENSLLATTDITSNDPIYPHPHSSKKFKSSINKNRSQSQQSLVSYDICDDSMNDLNNKTDVNMNINIYANSSKNNFYNNCYKRRLNRHHDIGGPEDLHFFYVKIHTINKKLAYKFDNFEHKQFEILKNDNNFDNNLGHNRNSDDNNDKSVEIFVDLEQV